MQPSQEQQDNWHKDPNNWKLGMFYYNPEDPRGIIPKKIQWMGLTINFANTKAVIGFFLMMIFFGFVFGVISLKGK